MNIPVDLIDADPNSTTQSYIQYAREEGRELLSLNPKIKIIDTAGVSGSALSFLRKATLILCPFKANFADTDIMVNWFYTLNESLQKKFVFIPNMLSRAKEHRLGIEDIDAVIKEIGHGILLSEGIKNRSAIYPELMRGNKKNFFNLGKRYQAAQLESMKLCQSILKLAEEYK